MIGGALRDYLTFQAVTVSQDAYGGVQETYADSKYAWGEVSYMNGTELWKAQSLNANAQGKIRIRSNADILPTMRVKHGAKYLEILSVYPADNKNIETEIVFREWLD